MVHHLSRQWTPPFPFRSLPSRGMNRLACFYAAFNPLQVTSNNYHPTFNFSSTRVSIMPHENTFHVSFKKSFIASKKSFQMTQSLLVNIHFLFPQLFPQNGTLSYLLMQLLNPFTSVVISAIHLQLLSYIKLL